MRHLLLLACVGLVGLLAAWFLVGPSPDGPGPADAVPRADRESPEDAHLVGRDTAAPDAPSASPSAPSGKPDELVSVRVRTALYETGEEAPDVLVVVVDAAGRRHEGRTDVEGYLTLEHVTPGPADFEAVAPGWVAETLEQWRVTGDAEQVVYLGLMRPTAVRGRVLSAIDDRPIAGARVIAAASGTIGDETSQRRGDVWGAVTSDEDGSFRFEAVPLGKEATITTLARGFARNVEDIVIREMDASGEGLVFRLRPGAVLHGRVVDRSGSGISGAIVFVFPDGDEILQSRPQGSWTSDERTMASLRGVTDAEGLFAVHGLAVDARYAATAMATGHARTKDVVGLVPTTAVPDVEVTLVLLQPGVLEVVVVREDGTPVTAGRATLISSSPWAWPQGASAIDAKGRARLAGIDPGTYELAVEAPDLLSASQSIEVSEGETRRVEVRLRRGAVIAGVVLDADGHPLVGATIGISREGAARHPLAFARSGADGGFRFEGLEFLPHDLNVNGPQHVFEPLENVVAPAPDLRLQGVRLGRVTGVLVLPPGVAAPEQVQVRTRSPSGTGSGYIGRWPTDPVEWFLAQGRHVLRVEGVGFAPWTLEVRLEPGAVRDLGAIRLARGLDVMGVVVGEDGRPVPGAAVVARDHAFRETVADAEGRFALRDLRAGGQELRIRAAGFLEREVEMAHTVSALNVRIVLERGGALALLVLDAEGLPIVESEVWIAPSDIDEADGEGAFAARETWDETNEQGRVALRLPAGAYRIEVSKNDVMLVAGQATLREGRSTELTLRAP